MNLQEGEKTLFSGTADTLFLKTFRKGSVTLALTNQRLIIEKLLTSEEYSLSDIDSVERFKAMFMNIGLRFRLKNGKNVELATGHVRKYIEHLEKLGKI